MKHTIFEMGHSLETRFVIAPDLICAFLWKVAVSKPTQEQPTETLLLVPLGEGGISRCTDVKQRTAPLTFRVSVLELALTAMSTEINHRRNKKLLC